MTIGLILAVLAQIISAVVWALEQTATEYFERFEPPMPGDSQFERTHLVR